MSTEQVGAYILLLCKSWREKPPGSLPSDDSLLAKWARVSLDHWSEIRSGVLAPYAFGTDSRWHQKRQRVEYDKLMSFRRDRSRAAKSRWDKEKHARALHEQCIPSPIPSPSKDQSQNPRAEPARASPTVYADEKRRNIEARNQRVEKEIDAQRESMVGMGPGLEHEVERGVRKIASKMASLQPLSQAEYERRKKAQRDALEKKYPGAIH